ncbi:hypothetical protein BJ912DRAFT_946827 [Pholiota molesta]|nr:hypothetical protein BJ912DRAFT_946827 [Pholiota molesta]
MRPSGLHLQGCTSCTAANSKDRDDQSLHDQTPSMCVRFPIVGIDDRLLYDMPHFHQRKYHSCYTSQFVHQFPMQDLCRINLEQEHSRLGRVMPSAFRIFPHNLSSQLTSYENQAQGIKTLIVYLCSFSFDLPFFSHIYFSFFLHSGTWL